MATTYVDYPPATSGQTEFEFTFPYLEDEHVKVEINGVETTAFTISTTPTQKVVLDAPGATAGDQVRVRRRSAPNEDLVDFVNGSVLTESELDLAYRHNRYLAEEIAELNDVSLQIEAGGTQWDAKDLRIQNVGTPTDTTDAVTKIYLDNKVAQVSSGATQPPLKWQFTGLAGANGTYTVTGAEVQGDTAYEVSIDGLIQEPGVDFTVNPNTDTLTIVPTLVGGEDIVVIQRGFGVAIAGTVGTNSLLDGSVTSDKISTTDTKFNVQSNGNVGIGTTSPVNKLQVNGDILAEASNIQVTNGGVAAGVGMYSPAPNEMGLSTNSAEHIRIDSDGNVGIGTASPESSLHIYAETNPLEDTTLLTIENYSGDLTTNGSFISFKFTDDNANEDPQVQIGAIVGQNADATSSLSEGAGAFVVKTNNPSGDGTTSPGDATQLQERLRVDYAGNVGIGITNPAHALDVAGDVNVSLGNTFKINGANFLLDEDTMSSNSDTQGATQQSIKAYVDTQVGLGISKWDSGWVDQDDQTTPISVGSGATMVFDHDLGSAALGSVFSVYAAEDSSGTDMESQKFIFWYSTTGVTRGIQVKSITSTQVIVQLGSAGYEIDSSGNYSGKPWGTGTNEFSHIRVVLVG